MTIRYQFTDTLVSKTNNLIEIQEFTNLYGLNILSKIPIDGGIVIFALDNNYNINYGKFVLGVDDKYTGEFVVVSEESSFENVDDIFVLNGFYNPNESFYIFYNKNSNIYLKSFLVKQGFFSSEVSVKEKAKIKNINRIKESFFVVYEDTSLYTIYSQINELGDGELKILFICENDIDRFLGNVDYSLDVKEMESPFNDIGETSWTSENKVDGDRGFLYISNPDVLCQFDENSINGSVFVDPGTMYVKMDDTIDDYTLTIRCQVKSLSGRNTLLTSENFNVEYDVDHFYFTTMTQGITSDVMSISGKSFYNISLVQEIIENKYLVSMYIDDIWSSSYIINKEDLPNNFTNDNVLIIDNVSKIDYLSLQKYSLSKEAIIDYHNSFDRKLVSSNYKKSYSLYKDDLNGLLSEGDLVVPLFPSLNQSNKIEITTIESFVPLITSNIVYQDGYTVPITATSGGQYQEIVYEGFPYMTMVGISGFYSSGLMNFDVTDTISAKDVFYTKHFKLNSSYHYTYGKYMYLDRVSDNEDMKDVVIPIFLDDNTGIPAIIYSDPTSELRVCENLSQVFDTVPFIVEENSDIIGMTVWISMNKLRKQVGFQYGLKNYYKNLSLHHTYSQYESLSNLVYNTNSYYFAYHFDRLMNQRRILVKQMTLDVTGEIMLGGVTNSASYIREIKSIIFVDNPKKYKVPEFRIDLDVKDLQDRESYINNADEIKNFVKKVIIQWKPATDSINSIVEKNTLIMAQLMRDEFTQVIVGFTPGSNVNAFYVRSVETGQVNILTSSLRLDDPIDFIGIGRIDTPYIKSGVTKIKTSAKNVKIFFETSFSHSSYRVFVFNPNNSLYYVPVKDKDGFIVESSSLVETEVAWIALNTYQIRNGNIVWKHGIPLGESLFDNASRSLEINSNSNKYKLDFVNQMFPETDNEDYSIILSSNSNLSLWTEEKTIRSFVTRRSYAGQDTNIDWMLVGKSEKWWSGITS